MVKHALCLWSLPADWDFSRRLQVARAAGFAGVELLLSENGEVNLKSTPAELLEVSMEIDRAKLVVSGLGCAIDWSLPKRDADPGAVLDVVERQLECAACLGVDTATLRLEAEGNDAWHDARELIKILRPTAEHHRVFLGIENSESGLLSRPDRLRDFIDSFWGQWVGACLNAQHVPSNENLEDWIHILRAQVRRIELSVGNQRELEWPDVRRELRESGYSGWVHLDATGLFPADFSIEDSPKVLREFAAISDS